VEALLKDSWNKGTSKLRTKITIGSIFRSMHCCLSERKTSVLQVYVYKLYWFQFVDGNGGCLGGMNAWGKLKQLNTNDIVACDMVSLYNWQNY